jgi:riboflavin biosynthesis pyrimidine reductase
MGTRHDGGSSGGQLACDDGDVTASPELRRVHPLPAARVSIADAYRSERPPSPATGERPWVGLCMITSLDGSATLDGTSGGLGNANDREILVTLREHADVVIVGATTVRGEGYGTPGGDVRIGVVTNSGEIDAESELFRSGAGFVITSEATEIRDGIDTVRAGSTAVDLAVALARLGDVVGDVGYVHAEGGPTLNRSLLELDLVDELALTIAPTMVGGSGPRVTVGGGEVSRPFDLAHLLVDAEGYTFGRWVRRRADTG